MYPADSHTRKFAGPTARLGGQRAAPIPIGLSDYKRTTGVNRVYFIIAS